MYDYDKYIDYKLRYTTKIRSYTANIVSNLLLYRQFMTNLHFYGIITPFTSFEADMLDIQYRLQVRKY